MHQEYELTTYMNGNESCTVLTVDDEEYVVTNTVNTDMGMLYVCEGGQVFCAKNVEGMNVLVQCDVQEVITKLTNSIQGVIQVIQFFQRLHDAMHAAEEVQEEEMVPEGEPSY